MNKILFFIFLLTANFVCGQTIVSSTDFSLGSPFVEPDGRSDYVLLPDNTFITLAKTKGSVKGSSDFLLEKYNQDLKGLWKVNLQVESSEDFKDLFYNEKEVILLSVVHLEKESKTKLEAYAYDPENGKELWKKELESYQVEDWEIHPHKGRVKESFVDVVCEHSDPNFITPFQYKHHIHFSPDNSKFISYIYNYGEKKLTATVSVYDNSCNLINRGKISVDDDFTNHGFYVNNKGEVFIVNANNFGKVNLIKYDLNSKEFNLLDIPGSNLVKDDFQLAFDTNDKVTLVNSEVSNGKVLGVMVTKFDFKAKTVKDSLHLFSNQLKGEVLKGRKTLKGISGEEDWKDYDISSFVVYPDHSILFALEKRLLYSDGYPHIGRDVFDKSHEQQTDGHIKAEGLILIMLAPTGYITWSKYIPKNQVYPAMDGLNTVSYVINAQGQDIKILYATSENMNLLNDLKLHVFDKETGEQKKSVALPNPDKLTLVRDFTVWTEDGLIIVGKKGMLGRKSEIVKYKVN